MVWWGENFIVIYVRKNLSIFLRAQAWHLLGVIFFRAKPRILVVNWLVVRRMIT